MAIGQELYKLDRSHSDGERREKVWMVDVRNLSSQSLTAILFKSITVPMTMARRSKYRVSETVTVDIRSFLIMLLKALWLT